MLTDRIRIGISVIASDRPILRRALERLDFFSDAVWFVTESPILVFHSGLFGFDQQSVPGRLAC